MLASVTLIDLTRQVTGVLPVANGGNGSTGGALSSITNCASATGSCGSARAGAFAIAAGGTSIVVSTTAATLTSEIIVYEDSSLSGSLGACNSNLIGTMITARSIGSFTVTAGSMPMVQQLCLSYIVVN